MSKRLDKRFPDKKQIIDTLMESHGFLPSNSLWKCVRKKIGVSKNSFITALRQLIASGKVKRDPLNWDEKKDVWYYISKYEKAYLGYRGKVERGEYAETIKRETILPWLNKLREIENNAIFVISPQLEVESQWSTSETLPTKTTNILEQISFIENLPLFEELKSYLGKPRSDLPLLLKKFRKDTESYLKERKGFIEKAKELFGEVDTSDEYQGAPLGYIFKVVWKNLEEESNSLRNLEKKLKEDLKTIGKILTDASLLLP
jgi:hypothetical protein